jgi:uncharacterized protein DUF6152
MARIRVGVCVALLLVAIPAVAHHSQTAFYDPSKKVEVNGTVAQFVFKNPHVLIVVDATDEQGQKVQWQVEMGSTTLLTRQGWTQETIRTGEPIKIVGQPSRAQGTYGICCAQISRADGSPFVASRGRGRGL